MYPMIEIDIKERGGPGQSNFGDSASLLLSIYSDAAEEEDNMMVKRWQKDANGFLIFTGLFSAAVAALLAVTVQDLKPSSQDISAFYLGNIYEVLADPNVTRPSSPSPIAKLPPFSPPRSAIWVNSLWFLSLAMSLSCALLETSLQQWARRYLPLTQPAQYSPEKRARLRAFFANGVEKMHVPRAVEGLPALLHLSLFLFFGGLVIFLFNINHEVFISVFWWIGLFSMVYGLITLLPIIRHDSPYISPLSTPTWLLYASLHHITFKILAFIPHGSFWDYQTRRRYEDLRDRYQRWMLGGVEKAAEETASERSLEIDIQILDWTISALGDDDSLKRFFEAIPGFLNHVKLRGIDFSDDLRQKFTSALGGFLDRTWSSDSANKEKIHRLEIVMNAMDLIQHSQISLILQQILFKCWGEVPKTVEMGFTLARWCTDSDPSIARDAQRIVTGILLSVQERNGSWFSLAAKVFGPQVHDLQGNITSGIDSVLLFILIKIISPSPDIHYAGFDLRVLGFLGTLPKLNIRNTLPELQHEFCTLWNKIVQEARNRGSYNIPTAILRWICPLYTTLHQGIDASPTTFSVSADPFDSTLDEPLSYQLCKLSSHYPEIPVYLPTRHHSPVRMSPTDSRNFAPRQVEQVIDLIEPPPSPDPKTFSKIGATPHSLNMTPPTNPVPSGSRPAGASRTAIVTAASQDITSTATVSHSLEGSDQQDSDIVVPGAQPGTGQILSRASTRATPTLAPIQTFLPNTPSESYHATGVASVFDYSHIASASILSSIPASRPSSSTTLPHLRARGLVNTGNICFANAVLQLLVNSPPFWNLFRELGDLKRQRGLGVPETGGGATPLVDATVRFFKEFIVEESPSTQQQSQPATGGTSTAGEEKKDDSVVDSFEPRYLYDAMKEKRQLKPLLDGQQQDAEEFLCLYLDALDEELPLLASIGGRQSPSAALEVEEHGMSQSGRTEVGSQASQGFMANFVESPTTRLFGGKYRSLVRANQPDPVLTEDWRSLHLNIQPDSVRTIEEALMRVFQPQVGGSGLDNASQQVLIELLPPVLVLHLNRVQYDVAAGGIKKIGKSIQLAPELKIPLDIMVPNAQRPSEPPQYKLYGVLYHQGETAGGGHYTVDVLRPNGDGDAGEVWLRIDNEAVSPVRHEDVFRVHGTERVADERCAYLLFYSRTFPIGTP